eukprot:m.5705 g.5705  ORF g.5705 m.5705 type:complete len:283 (+) comp5602_c0_seq2:84-932(+)
MLVSRLLAAAQTAMRVPRSTTNMTNLRSFCSNTPMISRTCPKSTCLPSALRPTAVRSFSLLARPLIRQQAFSKSFLYTQVRTAAAQRQEMKTLGTRLKFAGVCVAATVVGGGLVYMIYRVSAFFSRLSLIDVTGFGFFCGGIVTTLLGVSLFLFGRRFLSMHPEAVYKEVMQRVTSDALVKHRLGSNIMPGKFKAYAYKGGLIFDARKSVLGVPCPRFETPGLEMIFQLQGSNMGAMVSVDALNSKRHPEFLSLAVDFADGDRLVMAGGNDDVIFQGTVRLR